MMLGMLKSFIESFNHVHFYIKLYMFFTLLLQNNQYKYASGFFCFIFIQFMKML